MYLCVYTCVHNIASMYVHTRTSGDKCAILQFNYPLQLLLFIANTSSECVLYPGHGLNEPSPCPSLEREEDELAMAELLEAQDQREGDFWSDASKLPW